MDTLRRAGKPLGQPAAVAAWGLCSYQRALRVLTGVDHYARSLARLSDGVREPGWAPTLRPRRRPVSGPTSTRSPGAAGRDAGDFRSAEDLIDAAEASAARTPDPAVALPCSGARLLRRIDQVVVGFATDIG